MYTEGTGIRRTQMTEKCKAIFKGKDIPAAAYLLAYIPGPSVCISHFSRFLVILSFFKSSSGCFSFSMIFSFLAVFQVLQWTFLNYPRFSAFLAIFQVLKCVFLIFRNFQFSRHIPGPSLGISHFSCFLLIS